MNVQTIALKKGKDAISHRVSETLKNTPSGVSNTDSHQVQQCLSYKQGVSLGNLRCLSTEQDISNASKAERAKEHVKDLSNKHKAQKQVKALEKVSGVYELYCCEVLRVLGLLHVRPAFLHYETRSQVIYSAI